ncbi:cell wall-active antibiotics response protein LiaF [Streptococcus iners]|uniref:Cell wall-active antibiotics response protein LiaF n=1 Tax=Streptococcus iners TaxID=3028084 RepID=A0AA96VUG9_9STRE|nr:cell wall-active antibiotics response protein LiaF [Streptococcus sp. 29887]MCK4025553.1 cell wall-active antibiotics response protein [Streptococcus suis]WNY51479.1 cell wall-active antibiotics response protein LiaF [Streptococcus sp. 29887]
MRKVQFFLLIESMLFTMAAFDVVANEASRTLLLFSALLLLAWYFLGRRLNSVLLVSSLSLVFLVFVLNPYFIIGVMLLVVYMFVNFFSRYEKRNQYTQIVFTDYALQVQKEKNRWFGNHDHSQDRFGFEDINIVRLFGNDVVDLDKTVLVGRDNIVVIRKTFGRTKIIVPIDVEVSLTATTVYGKVTFLEHSTWDLRNESIAINSPDYQESHKRVKVVTNNIFGDVEVVRV